MKIFFSVGEPSGDIHGANLIRALQTFDPSVECVGFGGPLMAQAGARLHFDLTSLAVMWFLRVLLNIHRFFDLLRQADRYFRQEKPDAVVLIDYPGFNWWVARRAKLHNIPVFYYSPPQIWGWASWRIKKMRRWVDHILCGLPFEEKWFRDRGCNATFVGHPYFDEVRRQELDQEFLARQRATPGRLVTLLPGSRTQEVEHNLHWFIRAAGLIQAEVPDVRFAVAAFKPHQADLARRLVKETDLPIEIHLKRTPELIHLAECCLAVSGSVSLELLFQCKPTVILYWISRPAYFVQGLFRRVKYITLVNLLSAEELFPKDLTPYDPSQPGAEKIPFPEYLTWEDRSAQLAAHVVEWLKHEPARKQKIEQLERLKVEVGHGGASRRAAQYILETLARSRKIPRPHFQPEQVAVGRKS